MKAKKSSWDYQRDRYKQINIKFDMNSPDDATLYHFVSDCTRNTSGLIKQLLRDEMVRCAYGEK